MLLLHRMLRFAEIKNVKVEKLPHKKLKNHRQQKGGVFKLFTDVKQT
jgi:hypothetical protein